MVLNWRMRRTMSRVLGAATSPVLISAIAIGGLAGCLVGCQRGVVIREEVIEADEGMVVPGPFAPTAMRIHPLTHTEADGESSRIVLHVEVRDGWGDTIKGVGDVQVHLRRSGSATIGESGIKWDIDLRDLTTNVSYFDSVTRTYRFVLSGMPDWFAIEGRGKLRVQFRTARGDGSIEVFQDEFEIERVLTESE